MTFVITDSEIALKEEDVEIVSDDKAVESDTTCMGIISLNIVI